MIILKLFYCLIIISLHVIQEAALQCADFMISVLRNCVERKQHRRITKHQQ